MILKFAGHASSEIPGDAHTSWLEASTLGWLKGYDKVMLTGPPEVGATFTLVEDRWRTTCRFTRVEPPSALCWEGEDGSAGTLEFEPRGNATWVKYHAVYVPMAAADKVAAGLIGVFARSKAQRESDKDAAGELNRLARRVRLRVAGKPIDDRVPRFMLDMCDFGAGTLDPCTIPMFSESGQLLLVPGEAVLWTGTGVLAAESAQAAGGREQFETMWKSDEKAAVTLTDQRLVYDIRRFTMSRARRAGVTAAGQIRHENLANLITGDNARTTFAGPATVTATLMEPPKRMIRIHLIADSSAEQIAWRWIQAAASDRLKRLAGSLSNHPGKRDELLAQQHDPKPHIGYWGPFWGLPLPCPLGQNLPIA
jgi:hypothetical protein